VAAGVQPCLPWFWAAVGVNNMRMPAEKALFLLYRHFTKFFRRCSH